MSQLESDLTENTPTSGGQLKAAREKAGLSIEDVAKKLYLTATKVTALEGDQYEKLPSPMFVQGYLRKYAALLNIDSDDLIQNYSGYLDTLPDNTEQTDVPEPKVSRMVVGRKPPKWIVPTSLFLFVVLILSAVFIFNRGDVGSTDRSNPTQADRLDLPQGSLAIQEKVQEDEAAGESFNQTVMLADQLEGLAEQELQNIESEIDTGSGSASVGSMNEEQFQNQPQLGQLVFGFSDECWLEVRDTTGKVLHAALHNVGDPVVVNGVGPFSILLGNARAVSISKDGEALAFEIEPGHRTAKLTIP